MLSRTLFLIIFFWLLSLHCFKAQDPYVVDSITKELPKLNDTEKEPYYAELAWQYIFSDYAQSFTYAKKALNYAEISNDSVQLSDAYNILGAVYIKKSMYDSAIYFNEQSLHIRTALGDIRGMGGSFSKLGSIYTDQAYFDKALDLQLKALDCFIKSQDPVAEAQTYNNICQIYNYLNNFDMAIFYARKCIKMYEDIDYPYGEATAISNLAIYYEKINQLDSAIYYTKQGMEIFKSIDDYADIANSENSIAIYYRKLGDDKEGIKHYNRAYNIAVALNDEFSMSHYNANRGSTYLDLGMKDSAFYCYTNSLELAEKHSLIRVQHQCYDGFANYYEKIGDYKSSLEYRKIYQVFNDSILNTELQEAMTLADAKFQTTYNKQLLLEKENVIQKEQKENALLAQINAEKELDLKQNQLIFLIVVAVLVIVAILALWYLNKKRLEKERTFAKNLAEEKEKGLQKTLQAQEEERKRIAKDLHDGIVQEIVAIKLAITEGSNGQEIVSQLDKTASEIRNLSHQMMPYALKELGLAEAVEDLLGKLLPKSGVKFDFDTVGEFSARFSEGIEIMLYRVTQELINNTLKHSGASHVGVTLTQRNNNVTLIFEDNGKGFDTEKRSEGIGISNMKSRVASFNGEFKVESTLGNGSMFIIRVPLKR